MAERDKETEEAQILLDLNNFPKAQELMRAVFSDRYRVIVYGGAIRGGKSYNCMGALILLLRKYHGARAAIVRKDLRTLKRNTLPICRKIVPSSFLKLVNSSSYIWKSYEDNLGRFSEMFFFSENYDRDKELTRWDGLEVNYFFIDQIEEIHEESFTKAVERMGSYFIPGLPKEQQPHPKILASLNPSYNWVRRLVYERWKSNTLPDDWCFIPASIHDNPHVPKSYLESLETMKETSPSEYKRRVQGDWNYMDGSKMLYDPEAILDIPYNTWIAKGEKYLTADIALDGSDRFVVVVWDGWRAIDWTIIEKIDDPTRIGKIIIQKCKQYQVPRTHVVYDADGIGAFLKGPLRVAKAFKNNARPLPLPHTKRKKTPVGLVQPNYENLKTQCYYGLRSLIKERAIYADVTGTLEDQLVEELSAMEPRDADAEGKLKMIRKQDVKKKIGRSPDLADNFAMRYFFELQPKGKPKSHAV